MNLHAPLPLDEAPAAPVDPVARLLADARISDGAALLDALDARRIELGLANTTVEQLAGLCEGHLTKIAGPSRERSPSLRTLDRVMAVLGLSFVLVRDPEKEKTARMLPAWRPRDTSHVRARALSATTIARARPHVIADLTRRAARPRWKDATARDFLQAMSEQST
jgi:hypothetical protein